MISYHLEAPDAPAYSFSYNFNFADVDDVERIAKCASQFVWSPIVWKGGIRRQDHFFSADWLVLDFDTGEMTLKEARKRFCDYEGFIGTTKSHQKLKGSQCCDRFRVAVRFEKRVTDLRVYRWNMQQLMSHYPCDKSCKDGARFFYPCTEIVELWQGKDYARAEIDLNVPKHYDRPKDYHRERENGVWPTWTKHTLMNVIPEGERNTTIYRVSKDLYKVGETEERILSIILNSRTYLNSVVSHELRDEIHAAVRSGVRKAEREIAEMNAEKGD